MKDWARQKEEDGGGQRTREQVKEETGGGAAGGKVSQRQPGTEVDRQTSGTDSCDCLTRTDSKRGFTSSR